MIMPTISKIKKITLYVLAIIIAIIINCITSNDTAYVPKSSRSKLGMWLRNKMQEITYLCGNRLSMVIDKVISSKIFRTKRKRKLNRASMRWSYVSIKVESATAMTSQVRYYNAKVSKFDVDSSSIGIDNRCSACISHLPEDFVGPLKDSDRTIKGFAGSKTTGVKVGTLLWKWLDDLGVEHTFKIPNSYFVPSGGVRLLSPQHWAKYQLKSKGKRGRVNGTLSQTTSESVTLFWNDRKAQLTVPLSRGSNVATFHMAPGFNRYSNFCMSAKIDQQGYEKDPLICEDVEIRKDKDVAHQKGWGQDIESTYFHDTKVNFNKEDTAYDNIPRSRQVQFDDGKNVTAEMLKLHHRLGHPSFYKMRTMAKQGVIPSRFAKCDIPVCAACTYAKIVKRPWRGKSTSGFQKSKVSRPGQIVSVDQLVSPTPGLIAQMTGRLTTKRYKYATIFVDQYSKVGYIHIQKTSTAEETIEGKNIFEAKMKAVGADILAYQADNGIFRAHAWVQSCKDAQQQLTFTGVNAHHQNGHAEKRIRDLQDTARTMIMHANKRWPSGVSTNLWPYAIRMASDMYNNSPHKGLPEGKTPNQVASGSDVNINVKHIHTFGCPVYVLSSELQQNKPFGKWKQRAQVGIYLGPSPHHNRNVALVLSRTTGLVSPQFHIRFDDNFDTVDDIEVMNEWKIKAGFVAQREHKSTHNTSHTIEERSNKRSMDATETDNDKAPPSKRNKSKVGNPLTARAGSIRSGSNTDAMDAVEKGLRRSSRLNPELQKAKELVAMMTSIMGKDRVQIRGEILASQETPNIEEYENPMAFKASTDPDIMYLHEAMQQHDREKFVEAMEKEVHDQMANGNFTIVKRSNVPEGKTILPSVWQMRRKRDIKTRTVKKYKARLNIDGSRMRKGVHYDQTYAPVVSWNSIRLLLVLVAIHGWNTRQIDYVLAFPQAPVEKEIYMRVPKGFKITGKDPDDYVLKLNKNVYGQKQAGRVWNKYLEKKLIEAVGLKKSKIDECVYYKGKTIYLLYTDDSILAGPCQKEINNIIKDIRSAGLNITEEGDIQDFLGINIQRRGKGEIELTQPHLIDQIIRDMKMDQTKVKTKDTPAMSSKILHRDENAKSFDKSFHYRSLIGKLNYLEKGTRSDISYIVHQCARFTEEPKESHAKVLRWLTRYLIKTKEKGFVMRPDTTKGIEVFVDADFAGNWDKHDTANSDTARSRHGYIIKYMNCPIVWKSQLQQEIALSSTESEYTGLSYALREAIPIMELLKEMTEYGFINKYNHPKVYCRVYEDNSGALEMATVHKYRPRTKHINVKLHHFRSYVNKGEIEIHPIGTENQEADYLTKPVPLDTLERLRIKVMGW